ncbi:MAG: 1-phosphofructokinase family hexose kinase [Proteobacteria bacterium]|nr:1-phosphofructokinase family hexose kinase [Pseudomonadota bacterium]
MALVLTLTPNPALDVFTAAPRITPGVKLRCSSASRDPGGGGLNVARVVSRLGGRAVAIYPSGGASGEELQSLIRRDGVESLVVRIDEPTRENFTVFDETTREEYRFVLPGPRLREPDWMRCLHTLAASDRPADFICASGSLPPGTPADFYARAGVIARMKSIRFVVDTSGAALKAALDQGVYLVKPNLAELREIVPGALDDEASLIAACRQIIRSGGAEVVALTLGAQGALLVTAEAAWRSPPLDIDAASSVGAGDSFLGAMVSALAAGLDLPTAFAHGAAGGAAALLAPGTGLATAGELRSLLARVVVEPIGAIPAAAGAVPSAVG